MKLNMKEIKDAEKALTQVLMHEVDFKLAYRMKKIANQLLSTIRKIEDYRQGLILKYGVENADKRMMVPPDKTEAFVAEFNKFLDSDTEIDIQQIPVACMEGLKIAPVDLAMLDRFLEVEQEAKVEIKR